MGGLVPEIEAPFMQSRVNGRVAYRNEGQAYMAPLRRTLFIFTARPRPQHSLRGCFPEARGRTCRHDLHPRKRCMELSQSMLPPRRVHALFLRLESFKHHVPVFL